MASKPMYCPRCGKIGWADKIAEGKGGFSTGKAAAGAVLLGPVGLLGGALGKKQYTYQCKHCNFQATYND